MAVDCMDEIGRVSVRSGPQCRALVDMVEGTGAEGGVNG